MIKRDYAALAKGKILPEMERKRVASERAGDLQSYIDLSRDMLLMSRNPAGAISWIDDLGGDYSEDDIVAHFMRTDHGRKDASAIADMHARISKEPEVSGQMVYCVGSYQLNRGSPNREVAMLSREGGRYFYDVIETACAISSIAAVLGDGRSFRPATRKVERKYGELFVDAHFSEAMDGVLHLSKFTGAPSDYVDSIALGLVRDNQDRMELPAGLVEPSAAR
jgi:hypothetical protein